VVHRLGAELTVRLPRRELGGRLVANELRWLPRLAALVLPMPVPEPVRAGEPDSAFPWPWSVCRYVPGRPVGSRGLPGTTPGRELASFLRALHAPAPDEAPRNPWRGVPLVQRAGSVREALPAVPQPERRAATGLWEQALEVGEHDGPPLWLHGDLHGFNVLTGRDRITGVVDFGDLCVGDPATDLAGVWMVLDAHGRGAFASCTADPMIVGSAEGDGRPSSP
jgi:aminoglycoside phosphotransferase (APT) family kinase protein